jgi:hypothetical protein
MKDRQLKLAPKVPGNSQTLPIESTAFYTKLEQSILDKAGNGWTRKQ